MPISHKNVTPAESDAERADNINNCAARLLERIRSCVDQANRIASRGDKAAIVADLDPAVLNVLDSAASLVTTHTESSVASDLGPPAGPEHLDTPEDLDATAAVDDPSDTPGA